MNERLKTFYGEMTFDAHHCFLCGELLDSSNKTIEHIFPKWLQGRNDLWNQTLTILNGTKIKYKQLTVPCCKLCNTKHLSTIENEVKYAFENGIEYIRLMDKTVLYKWILKILYCILYKEISLKQDIKDKNSRTIITSELLKQYHLIFDYMQSIRSGIEIDEKFASIFVFEVHRSVDNNINEDFLYVDDILHAQFAIQSNEIGIICTLGDTQAIKCRLEKYFSPFYDMKLSKVQFCQLVADVFYNRTLLENGISGIFMPDKIVQIPPWNFSYREFEQKEYAKVLYFLLHQFKFKFEDLYSQEYDAVMNFMVDQDKRIIIYDNDGTYSKGKIHDAYSGETFKDVVIRIDMSEK